MLSRARTPLTVSPSSSLHPVQAFPLIFSLTFDSILTMSSDNMEMSVSSAPRKSYLEVMKELQKRTIGLTSDSEENTIYAAQHWLIRALRAARDDGHLDQQDDDELARFVSSVDHDLVELYTMTKTQLRALYPDYGDTMYMMFRHYPLLPVTVDHFLRDKSRYTNNTKIADEPTLDHLESPVSDGTRSSK